MSAGFKNSHLKINATFRNGNFSASAVDSYGNYANCNSHEMLEFFKSIYMFMKSKDKEADIAGIRAIKQKNKSGSRSISLPLKLYKVKAVSQPNADNVSIFIDLPWDFVHTISKPKTNFSDEEYEIDIANFEDGEY